MWRASTSRLQWMASRVFESASARGRLALGTGVSLLVLAALDRPQPQKPDDANPHSLPPEKLRILLDFPVSNCESSARMVEQPVRQVSRLARHQTIRKMDARSTRETLSSKYSVQWDSPLGEGAFGEVYLATKRETGEKVAVKKITKLHTDDVAFQREMNALMHLQRAGGHPNICSLHEHFNERGHYYLVLDLISGGEMFDHLVNQGQYSEADAARLVREVASALAFIHGLGTVHGDLKPENLMLSTETSSDAVVKLVDFGCAQVTAQDSAFQGGTNELDDAFSGKTPAYCPPEVLGKHRKTKIEPSMDMWALGVILYIMLTGMHPFDLNGNASDSELESTILSMKPPPLKDSPITAHLSDSAIDLIQKLMTPNPRKRLTAMQMLEHPWVLGKTASRDKIADSDKKLSMYRVFKSKLEAKVFADIVAWSDAKDEDSRSSLIERSFRSLDPQRKGYITTRDLRRFMGSPEKSGGDAAEDDHLSLAGFSNLLSENMKNRYFPTGHVIYHEGDIGNHMFFINSGTVEIVTKDGFHKHVKAGDFFGEGALFHPKKIRSATIKCVTPVHVIEISREYFDKYLASSGLDLSLNLREKDKTRKQTRAKSLLSHQADLDERIFRRGEYLYRAGGMGDELFILEDGIIDVLVNDQCVFTLKHGDLCGEHSLIAKRPRNSSAVCKSDICTVHAMRARDFYAFLKSSPSSRESINDICLRREFQKAIVLKTGKPFPKDEEGLREAFVAADEDSSGKISLENAISLLHLMDPNMTKEDVDAIVKALDLDDSGDIKFEEFRRIFGFDEARA